MADLEPQAPQEQLVNVFDPDTREVGSIPQSQLQAAVAQGYQPATNDQAKAFVRSQKFGGTGQQILTGLEGAASAGTFGLSTGLETALGVSPEDIQARREENPGAHMAGQMGALAATSLIPGLGEANLLGKVGQGATELAGLAGAETAAAKIGSQAVRFAAENAAFQSGEEISKGFSQDPNQNIQTAAVNIGLAGLLGGGLGGGIGAVSPLWDATVGPKVSNLLEAIKMKGGGGATPAEDALMKASAESGIELPSEIKTTIAGSPWAKQMAETLRQTDTNATGLKFQETISKLKNQASEGVLESFGKTEADLIPKDQLSNYQAGKNLGETLAKEMEEKIAPAVQKFEKISEKYKDLELPQDRRIYESQNNPYLNQEQVGNVSSAKIIPGTASQIADKIGDLVQKEGWYSSPSSEIMGEVNRVLKELPQQKTLKDLKNYITQIGGNTSDFTNPQLMRAGSLIKNVLRDAESELVMNKLGAEAPELVAEQAAARAEWKSASQLKDALNDRLHIGGGDSIGSFIKNLKAMAQTDGESVLRRISGKGDADVIRLLQDSFPETAANLKNYHVDELLGSAASKAKEGQIVDPKTVFDRLKKMSPELREFAIDPMTQQKVAAIEHILSGLESKTYNFSNTARTLDKLMGDLPGSAVALVTLLASHNPLLAGGLGLLTKTLGKDIPDAVRLGLLKFMGSEKPIDAGAFKAMTDFIQHTISGENLINKGTKAIFKAGVNVLPESMLPSEKDRKKLDDKLKDLQNNPAPLFETGGKATHYLPEHGGALGQTAGNAVTYLNQLRPAPQKQSPLDPEPKVSKQQEAAYQRALDIAEQPLLVLKQLKDGTLTPQSVQTMQNLYPALYQKLNQKIMNQMVDHLAKDFTIPHKMQMGLSIFMAQPMSTTMKPQVIQSMQSSFLMDQGKPQKMPSEKSMKGLSDLSKSMATPGQRREAQHWK